jgi:hypothetical protein
MSRDGFTGERLAAAGGTDRNKARPMPRLWIRDSHKTYYGISINQDFRAFRSLFIKEIAPEADNSIHAEKVIPS